VAGQILAILPRFFMESVIYFFASSSLLSLLFDSKAVMVIKFRSRLKFFQRRERISPFLIPVFKGIRDEGNAKTHN